MELHSWLKDRGWGQNWHANNLLSVLRLHLIPSAFDNCFLPLWQLSQLQTPFPQSPHNRATWFTLGDWLIPGPQQEGPSFHHYTITDRPRSTRKRQHRILLPKWQYAVYQHMHLTLHKARGRSHHGTLTFTQSASQEKREEAKPNLWNSGRNVMLGTEPIHTIPLHQSPQDLAITLTLA